MSFPHPHGAGRLEAVQNRLARAFGIDPSDRTCTVALMLTPSRDRAGYWLQIGLSMAIATLGLVLDSTAVVIGAMLISQLMGPIVGLGMGLATGSPFLVLRSFGRTASSVALVVGGSTALTLLLPFHQVTAEISSRTSPTALDLGVAVCCAIAAAYALIRPGSDTASTAAGTAVGIALVPPLCVVGYGLGTRNSQIAAGASLLFVANLCAILFFAVLAFTVLGYGLVDARALEREELGKRAEGTLGARLGHWLAKGFTTRYSYLLRVAMPLVLLAAVFVPLRRALHEVSWEIRVRSAIEAMVSALPETRVRSTITVQHHDVVVHLVTVGGQGTAADLRAQLEERIHHISGVSPTVDVVAVPDEGTLRALALELKPRLSAPAPAPLPPKLEGARAPIEDVLRTTWPERAAGPLLRWGTTMNPDGVEVEVVHLGEALGGAGASMLAAALEAPIGARPVVVDTALPARRVFAADRDAWATAARGAMNAVRGTTDAFLCLETPRGREGARARAQVESDASFDPRTVSITEHEEWSMRVALRACSEVLDAGSAGDAETDSAPVGRAPPGSHAKPR
jgi:uncharacterized hydrophobic protein (TIGR00271 family)